MSIVQSDVTSESHLNTHNMRNYTAAYGCETWSLTLTEEHRLRVFENGVLRRLFKPKGDKVTGQ
jgi:hypothetical protein